MAVSGKKGKFSSTLLQGSGEDYEIFCQPCDRDDLRLPAFGFCTDCEEHLCESCFNHHKRAKPLRHHILLDSKNMPQTLQVPSKSVDTGEPDDLTTPCSKHRKEILKFYCHDHEALLCSVCVTLEHTRQSCNVDYIPDISSQSLDGKEYTDTLKDLDRITEIYKKTTEEIKEKITNSNRSLTDILTEINKYRQEINKRLDELEKGAKKRAQDLQQENEKRLKTAEKVYHDVKKSLTASSDSIKQLNNSKQADRLFIELKLTKQQSKDYKGKLSQLASPGDIKEYDYQPNTAIASILQTENSLGKIKHTTSASSAVAVRLPNFEHQNDICVKTPQDDIMCWITGMVFLTPSKLVLTDNDNTLLKMIDLNNNSVIDQLKLDTDPLEITSVTSDQVAVTLPVEEKVQYISVYSNKLSLKSQLKVDGLCHGISCYQKKLVVTFLQPAKLQIIDLKGKVLKTVATNSKGEDIFSYPHYVTSNRHSIYISDALKHVVVRLNWQGEVTGYYGGVRSPAGLVMVENGSILVCDPSGVIQHISDDLNKGYVVLENLKAPFAICCCDTMNKLFISHVNGEEKYNNFIAAYKML